MNRKRLILIASLIAAPILSLTILLAAPRTAQAQTLSPGCQYLNELDYDAQYSFSTLTSVFYAGEVIILRGAFPYSVPSISLYMQLDGGSFQYASMPGTLSATIPATGSHKVDWGALPGDATWSVWCGLPAEAGQGQPFSAAVFLSDVCEPHDGFSADGWMTLDTDADDHALLPLLYVAASPEGPWAGTGYASPPYILNAAALGSLASLAGVSDTDHLWIKVTEAGQPVRLGSAIRERAARMDALCGTAP